MDADRLAEDVSKASAAYAVNLIPAIAALPATERLERLEAFFEAALAAYRHGLNGWMEPRPMPEPSRN